MANDLLIVPDFNLNEIKYMIEARYFYDNNLVGTFKDSSVTNTKVARHGLKDMNYFMQYIMRDIKDRNVMGPHTIDAMKRQDKLRYDMLKGIIEKINLLPEYNNNLVLNKFVEFKTDIYVPKMKVTKYVKRKNKETNRYVWAEKVIPRKYEVDYCTIREPIVTYLEQVIGQQSNPDSYCVKFMSDVLREIKILFLKMNQGNINDLEQYCAAKAKFLIKTDLTNIVDDLNKDTEKRMEVRRKKMMEDDTKGRLV